MRIEHCSEAHLDLWADLRAALWPEESAEQHRDEARLGILDRPDDAIAFIARDEHNAAVGFAEASLRYDYVNGCTTSPVAFLEGIYVVPTHRKRGVARDLVDAVAAWGREKGCTEFASDALVDNGGSHAMHKALGFAEVERVIYFRKAL